MGKDNEFLDACRDGDETKVNQWIANKGKRPRTPLNFLRSGSSWLSGCRDPSTGYTGAHLAALHGRTAILRSLLQQEGALLNIRDRRGCLPIHLAVWNGHMTCIETIFHVDQLFETINAVNNARETCLHLAAQHGHTKVIALLLQHHADPTPRNARGETPLDLASRFGRTAIVRLLVTDCPALVLQAASECATQKPASFPLHLAAKNGHLDVVNILLDAGFDIDFLTEQGTALHVAALFGKTLVVRVLLDREISVDSRNWQGRTVLEVLEEHQNEKSTDLTQLMQNRDAWSECRRLIEEHVAKTQYTAINKCHTNGSLQNGSVARKPSPEIQSYMNPDPQTERQGSPIWQRLPTAQKLQEEQERRKDEKLNDNNIYQHPPSMQAVFVETSEDDQLELASTISLSTTIKDSCALSPGGSSTISSCATFPLGATEAEQREKSPALRQPCTYVAPGGYDAWQPPAQRYDNLLQSTQATHPFFAYDNVPANLLSYDNAPPPGHRRWDHECTCPSDKTPSPPPNATVVLVEDCSQMDDSSDRLNISGSGLSDPPELNQMQRMTDSIDTDHSTCNSPGVKFTQELPRRNSGSKAPLALPEDLGGSTTTTDEGCRSPSPQRLSKSVGTPEEPPPSAWASESKIYDAIYPLSEELRRTSLSNTPSPLVSNKEQETQVEGESSGADLDCTSSCSECASIHNLPSPVHPKPREHTRLGREHSHDTPSPLDESAEWEKINDIMESFGAGICRESVFSERYESQIAVYLKNRKSTALTLQMNSSRGALGSALSPVAHWLKQLGLDQWEAYALRFESNGFDRVEFVRHSLDRDALIHLLQVDGKDAKLILEAAQHLEHIPSVGDFHYISDWLLALGCEDYLGSFMKANYDSMSKVTEVGWTEVSLEQSFGITLPGHAQRILASLAAARGEPLETIEAEEPELAELTAPETSDAAVGALESEINAPRHDAALLIHGFVSYSSHYLGSVEIKNLDGSTDSKLAIQKLKKSIREIAKVPQVVLEISYSGVRVLDALSKVLVCEHRINRIHCVCQDDRDLNCFAYITQDGHRHFCHVFCVLTADVATEIILTLGQAFEVAYQLATHQLSASGDAQL